MNIEQARFNMIEQQIRPWNVGDASVLDTLAAVKREDFVPAAHKNLAFADLEVALPGGQAMLTPSVEARLLQDLAVKPHETVLEIGTGSGYMAALLAHNALRVVTLEIVPELVTLARSNLQKSGIQNVEVREADGTKVATVQGSYDVIVLSGSVAEIPHTLLNLLKVGGRLAAIVGDEPMMRATVVTRNSSTAFTTVQAWDTVAPRLRNFPQPECFQL